MQTSRTPSATLALRPAQAEDEEFLFQLFVESQQQMAGFLEDKALLQSLIGMQYRGRKMTYAAQYPDAEDLILLGEGGLREGGMPLGRLLLDRNPAHNPACWRIVDIAMLAAHRGQGWGTRLIEECQRQCVAAGARLELTVKPASPARRLYERLGFRAAGEDALSVEMVWNGSGQGKRDEGIE